MKKIPFLSLIFVFVLSSSVQAFEWSYSFVIWDGKEYKVKLAELIEESDIGKRIGKVKTKPYSSNDFTDKMTYYGNASNIYPIGTPYYEIKGVSTSTAIAVKVDNQWVKAEYVRDAPFHIMNTITNLFIIVPAVMIGLIIIALIYRAKKINCQKQDVMQ